MEGGFCLSFELIGHEFGKGSKGNLLRRDPVRSSPNAVSDFKRHVEGKRKQKDSDRNRTLHKVTLVLLYSVQEKMERNLEDVGRQLKL